MSHGNLTHYAPSGLKLCRGPLFADDKVSKTRSEVTCGSCLVVVDAGEAMHDAHKGRAELRAFLVTDPALGGVNHTELAARLYARGLRAPVRP